MSHLVIVRHGETVWNVENRKGPEHSIINGQAHTPLTEHGVLQAIEAGRKIAERDFLSIKRAESSDLQRAIFTALNILASLPRTLKLHTTAAFRERYAGLFDGKKENDIYASHPEYRDDPRYNKYRCDFVQKAPGGENLTDVTERVWRGLVEAEKKEDGDILIISHAHAIRCLVGKALRLSQEDIVALSIPNATPIILERGKTYVHREGLRL